MAWRAHLQSEMYWYNRHASKILANLFSKQTPRVLLNGQCSSWTPVFAGVLQDSVLGSLFFLIYKDYSTKDISSTNKLFVDDTSIYYIVNDIYVSEHILNRDLKKISLWIYQWKISFNSDVSKQAQEAVFSKKFKNYSIQLLYLIIFLSNVARLGVRCLCRQKS